MSVQDLNRVHRRYIRVSNYFKSAWTFHQFLQGLQKVFTNGGLRAYPADFQPIYGDLKQVAKILSETTLDEVTSQLDSIEARMAPICAGLLAADDEVAPSLLRQFFQRVKNYDDNILSQLIKFYLFSQTGRLWNLQRLDKLDYLATKFAEEYHEHRDLFVLRDHQMLRDALQSFRVSLEADPVPDAEIDAVCGQLGSFRRELTAVQSIDDLHQQAIVQRYRDLKHGLGNRFFEPKILNLILEVNLALKNHIHQLYQREEQRIVAEYQQVFELEREVPVDVQLGADLAEFKQAVEHFETQLQGENLKLTDLVELRQRVRNLVPRLKPESDTQPTQMVPPREVRELRAEAGVATGELRLDPTLSDYVAEQFQRIIHALDDTNPTIEPKKIVLQPEIFSFNLSAREVVAYRRLFGGGTCDEALERFVLEAAALRGRIEAEVEEIKGILDDTSVTRDAPVYKNARVTCRHADLTLRRFEHAGEQCLLEGDVKEARELQILRMRLVRGFSGLWLMVYR